MKICVIDKETIKITSAIGGKNGNRDAEIVNRKKATRFMWMLGKRPVAVPTTIPKGKAKINSISI